MKFSNVKEKHIYNVIFDPVEPCEFDKKTFSSCVEEK